MPAAFEAEPARLSGLATIITIETGGNLYLLLWVAAARSALSYRLERPMGVEPINVGFADPSPTDEVRTHKR